ncbi:MarR family transcriptional regulator [Enterococcus pseudoavium]|nr:MarR family transcriptional regulator [Enterococcus pseudoavium]
MNADKPLIDAIDKIHLFNRLWLNTKKDLPIRPSEMSLLLLLVESNNPLTPKQAADALKVTKQMVTTMSKKLQKEGYIKKVTSASDRRSHCLLATTEGKELVEQRYEEYFKIVGWLRQEMKEDFPTFITLLATATDILEEGGKINGCFE